MNEKEVPWNGVPANPAEDGWHWLLDRAYDKLVPYYWNASDESGALWETMCGGDYLATIIIGFDYHAPCVCPLREDIGVTTTSPKTTGSIRLTYQNLASRKMDDRLVLTTDEIEVTPEMVEAGVSVLDDRLGQSAEIGLLQLERPDVAREMYLAMCKAATR